MDINRENYFINIQIFSKIEIFLILKFNFTHNGKFHHLHHSEMKNFLICYITHYIKKYIIIPINQN